MCEPREKQRNINDLYILILRGTSKSKTQKKIAKRRKKLQNDETNENKKNIALSEKEKKKKQTK